MSLNESTVKDAALEWFLLRRACGGQVGGLGYAVGHGPHLAPGEPAAERNRSAAEMDEVNSFAEVVLVGRLREAIRRLNPAIPKEARAVVAKSATVQIERRTNP